MKKFLASFPGWTFSIVWLIITIWFMNAPTPTMERLTDKLIHVDNICHMLLSGVFVFCLCFDWQRRREYKPIKISTIIILTLIALIVTGVEEVCQLLTPEEYRRWFDAMDLAWQGLGAIVVAVAYCFCQRRWVSSTGDVNS